MQAFPEERAPRYLIRDRDGTYGDRVRRTLEVLGIEEVVTTARSPWQNAYAERLIGSLRRECLDHIVILGEFHLLRILAGHFEYYNRARCHLSLAGDAPEPRPEQGPELGRVIELPEVGGCIIGTSGPRRDAVAPEGRGDGRLLVYSHAQGGQGPLLALLLAVAKPTPRCIPSGWKPAGGVFGKHTLGYDELLRAVGEPNVGRPTTSAAEFPDKHYLGTCVQLLFSVL